MRVKYFADTDTLYIELYAASRLASDHRPSEFGPYDQNSSRNNCHHLNRKEPSGFLSPVAFAVFLVAENRGKRIS